MSKMVSFGRDYWIRQIQLLAMYGVAFTLAFSMLNLNSIFIILMVAAWLVEGNYSRKWALLRGNLCFIAYLAYFLVLVLGMVYATSFQTGWKYVEGKLGFLALPLVLGSASFSLLDRNRIMLVFFCFLTIASSYCLVSRILDYAQLQDSTIFFYHELVEPIQHHAVYFSVFLFLAAAWFFSCRKQYPINKLPNWIQLIWLLYCMGVLILLSSKMVLIFGTACMLILLISSSLVGKKRGAKLVLFTILISILVLIFTFENPVSKRFGDILRPNTELSKDKFDRATYFNGVEFRVLLWRITYEILEENDVWYFGVGPTNGQTYLNRKYLELDLYAGNDGKWDSGYLVYNCHNQFLQTALQSGIVGLLVLLALCFALVRAALKEKCQVLICIVALLFCFFLIESVFERQYGILLATWLPFLFMGRNQSTNSHPHS